MKIGNVEGPDKGNRFRLPRLVEDTKKICATYENKPIAKDDTLAGVLGYKSSVNNGQFENVLRALKNFGLLEGRGTYHVTDTAKQIVYGTDQQRHDALKTAFLTIPLWKGFYERYRWELPKKDFFQKIVAITGIDLAEARSMEQWIIESYDADANVITSIKSTDSLGEDLTPPDQQLGGQPSSEGERSKTQFIEVKAGLYYSRMPYTEVGRNSIKTFLDSLKFEEEPKRPTKGEK